MTNFRKVVTSPAIVLSVIATILLVRYTIFQQSTKLSSSSSSSSSSSYVISRRDSDEDRYHVDPQLLQVSEHPDIDIRAKVCQLKGGKGSFPDHGKYEFPCILAVTDTSETGVIIVMTIITISSSS